MKYTLRVDSPEDNFSVEVKFEAEAIEQVIENVELFLRGAGFHPATVKDYINDSCLR